jgi:hypothetical protein
MNIFCTYCDSGYAARMRCLHESLVAQGEPFRLFVLCFDAATEAVVAAAGSPSLVAISLAELLAADPAYAAVRNGRSRVEFYFTSTPVLVRHCLQRKTSGTTITYLDADLFFFAPPSAVFAEQADGSIGIVPHRFPPRLAALVRHGRYNVGWVSFRRDENGMACIEWWRERCLEWCFDRVEEGRFADQGYLDEFPKRFAGVRVLDHPGINAAPWNVGEAEITRAGGTVQVNGQPLRFYHFQAIREVAPGWFDPGLGIYRTRLTRELRDLIYRPYLQRMVTMNARLRTQHGIEPVRGYLRIPTGTSWRERWERFRAGRLMTGYRRIRGRLLHCPEDRPAPRE